MKQRPKKNPAFSQRPDFGLYAVYGLEFSDDSSSISVYGRQSWMAKTGHHKD